MQRLPISLILLLCVSLGPPPPAGAAGPAAAETSTLTVLAAASLTEPFKRIAGGFEKDHPGLTVELGFAGSSTLATQINEGAAADVFAPADDASMQKVAGELAGAPRTFATNRLTIVVPQGNPAHIASLADLARSGITLALAAPQVPAGRYAAEVLAKAGVTVGAHSQEVDVRAALNKVALDEADAAIVYVTDVRAAGDKVEAVAIPDQYNVVAKYPIAVLKRAGDVQRAAAFVDYVLSDAGQATLRRYGFLPPP